MGNSQPGRGEVGGNTFSNWPMRFHNVHSNNIGLAVDKKRARRIESFCKGICFGSRPVGLMEKVYIKFAETSTSWSGVLRFGYSAHDPATINGSTLPRYACPDLTNKPGYWAKALGERYAEVGNVVYFYRLRNGDVMFGVNDEEKGLFLTCVNPNLPLWPLVDVYGNTVAMEFVDGRQFNNVTASLSSSVTPPVSPPANANEELNRASLNGQQFESANTNLPIRYHRTCQFAPLPFHVLHGRNIILTGDGTIAARTTEEYCNAYVFTPRPMKIGEKLVIQVLGIDRSFYGGMTFGMTSSDPSGLHQTDLPDDADLLLDRPEYWVVNKDICNIPELGDEISIYLSEEGEVHYGRNGNHVAVLLHIDKTIPMWAFFDVYGNTQKIKMLGVFEERDNNALNDVTSAMHGLTVALPHSNSPGSNRGGNPPNPPPRPNLRHSSLLPQNVAKPILEKAQGGASGTSNMSRQPMSMPGMKRPQDLDEMNECSICFEQPVDSVLYTCGHMCTCYDCALIVKEKGQLCPICRKEIKDVIKIYRS
ncbi:protein neuralized-like [Lineus longissimus]|uniref:protein neuralized-like n=1 Tax=Lineus longissimus TaxID=88925 RepID=UPI002B4F9E14